MRAAWWIALSLAGYAAIEICVFHSGIYVSWLDPFSSTGLARLVVYNEEKRPVGASDVLIVGDSRTQGLSPRLANSLASETSYNFASIAVPGSTPRVWYYLLRTIDPHRDRYAAIVFGLDDYDDLEHTEDL